MKNRMRKKKNNSKLMNSQAESPNSFRMMKIKKKYLEIYKANKAMKN